MYENPGIVQIQRLSNQLHVLVYMIPTYVVLLPFYSNKFSNGVQLISFYVHMIYIHTLTV